jgi:hypothetical protein
MMQMSGALQNDFLAVTTAFKELGAGNFRACG